MEIYVVGGAVRDKLLGLPVRDRDYCVVGATPEYFLTRGYQPVGKDFPVFLHPDTKEEYALARTERKVGPGYHGFVFHADPSVRLEEDLKRRDLTVNAIAESSEGRLIDPYGGLSDIQAKILRHVSVHFVEDPVRVLRLARFKAQLGFEIAKETKALVQHMVKTEECKTLQPERLFKETLKAMQAPRPEVYFETLSGLGVLDQLFKKIKGWQEKLGIDTLQRYRQVEQAPTLRLVAFMVGSMSEVDPAVFQLLPCSEKMKRLIRLSVKAKQVFLTSTAPSAEQLVTLFYQWDVFRRSDTVEQILGVLKAYNPLFSTGDLVRKAFAVVQTVKPSVLLQGVAPENKAAVLKAARIEAVRYISP